MRSLRTGLNTVSRFGLTAIALLLSITVFLLNIFCHAAVEYSGRERVEFTDHLVPSLVMIGLFALLFLAVSRFGHRIPWHRIKERHVFLAFTVLSSVAALYLILNVAPSIRADAGTCRWVAQQYAVGNTSPFFKGGYIYRYPHQLGLVLYDRLLYVFTDNVLIHFITNFLLTIGINFFGWRIANRLFGNHTVNLLTIACCFAFLPQFFFILFAYGLIPGLFCLMGAIYAALCYAHSGKWYHLLGLALGIGAAVCLKENYLIGGIAIVIYFFLQMLRRFQHRQWMAMLAVVAAMLLPSRLIVAGFEKATGAQLDQGCPTVLWIAMGTDMDSWSRAPGWYNDYNYVTYDEAEQNAELAAEIGTEKVKENLAEMAADPARALEFFRLKTVSMWCEPMFGSVWTGPLVDCGQVNSTDYLRDLQTGGEAEDQVETWMTFLTLVLWGSAVWFLIRHSRTCDGWEMPYLFFIGGFLFHLLWEGKSQYIYPYLFVLIPCCMGALYYAARSLNRRMRKNRA